jgi:hypothetical protein
MVVNTRVQVEVRSVLFGDAVIFEDYVVGVKRNTTKSKVRNITFKHYFNKILTTKIIYVFVVTFIDGVLFVSKQRSYK